MIFYSFFYFLIYLIHCSSTSSILLNQLRKSEKTISFQSRLSSPMEMILERNSPWNLTCSFLSNFPTIDIFWLHNGTLIQSFLSENRIKREEDQNSFLSLSIVSTIYFEDLYFDRNGFYQCIGVYEEIYAQQTFTIHFHPNVQIRTNFARHALITVHTSQALFEPRQSLPLICHIDKYHRKQCQIQWFNQRDEQLLNVFGDRNDFIIRNATFEDNMGLYTCQICCTDQCRKLTAFVYPTEKDQ